MYFFHINVFFKLKLIYSYKCNFCQRQKVSQQNYIHIIF